MPSKNRARQKHDSRLLQSLLPSAVASVVVHSLLLLMMFQLIRGCETGVPADAGGEEFQELGIARLPDPADRHTELDTPPTDDPTEPQPGETEPVPDVDAAVPEQAPSVSELLNSTEASPATDSSSETISVIGPGAPLPGLVAPMTQRLIQPDGGLSGGSPSAGPNAVSFEDIVDSGTRIVYLIDTSGSMSNGGRLDRAKNQLKGSLRMLEPHKQFQVIYYGDRPTRMRLWGGAKKMYQANLRNIELAGREIDNVELGGGTNHLSALEEGLKLEPEVIYFLTDGKDASHTQGDLNLLLRKNRSGARVHVVEFASGLPESRDLTWLHRLASETGGRYRRIQL